MTLPFPHTPLPPFSLPFLHSLSLNVALFGAQHYSVPLPPPSLHGTAKTSRRACKWRVKTIFKCSLCTFEYKGGSGKIRLRAQLKMPSTFTAAKHAANCGHSGGKESNYVSLIFISAAIVHNDWQGIVAIKYSYSISSNEAFHWSRLSEGDL